MTENVYAPPRANLETQQGPRALWDIELKQLKRLYYATLNIRALGVLYALGAFGLVAYAHGKRLFGPDRLLHKDVVDVYKQRKKAKA